MNRWRDGGLNQGGSCSISGWIQTSYTLNMIFFPSEVWHMLFDTDLGMSL